MSRTLKEVAEKIVSRCKYDPVKGCWLWQGAKSSWGYGLIRFQGRTTGTHRIMYEYFFGPLGTLDACHKCDVKNCVNPFHIFVGTDKDNFADAYKKGLRKRMFSFEQVDQIKAMSKTKTQSELAKMFGVCQPYISRLLNNKYYVK